MKYADYFKYVPTLSTARLTLRAFTPHDMDAYRAIIRDPDVLRYMGHAIEDFKDDAAVGRWLYNINNRILKSKTAFTWCIEHQADKTVIGRIDIGGFNMRAMGELSYHLSSQYWRRGLATEAVSAVTEFCLDKLLLHRIQAFVLPQNTASIKVLMKNGFEQEGLLRKYRFGKEFHDTVVLSLIKEENLGAEK